MLQGPGLVSTRQLSKSLVRGFVGSWVLTDMHLDDYEIQKNMYKFKVLNGQDLDQSYPHDGIPFPIKKQQPCNFNFGAKITYPHDEW